MNFFQWILLRNYCLVEEEEKRSKMPENKFLLPQTIEFYEE